MKVELDNENLLYTGRIDMRNPKKPEFVFPATSLSFRFYGKSAQKRFDLNVEGKR